jgi:hypothetical protein
MQGYGHVRRKPHVYSESHLRSSRAALHVFAVQVCIMCTLARRSLRSATTTTPSSSRGSESTLLSWQRCFASQGAPRCHASATVLLLPHRLIHALPCNLQLALS